MRMKSLILAIALLLPSFCFGQATLVAHTIAKSSDHNSVTTPAIDLSFCSSATHCMIEVCASWYPNEALSAPTSSQGDSFALIGKAQHPGIINTQMYVAYPTSYGSSVTFSFGTSRSGTAPSISVTVFSGIASGPDKTNSNTIPTKGAGNLAAGWITPANSDEVVLSCLGVQGGNTKPNSLSPLSLLDDGKFTALLAYGVASGYEIQTSATAVNPTWSTSLSGGYFSTDSVALVASFYSTKSPAKLAVSTTSLPEGFTGTAYSTTLTAGGGIIPYTWSQTAGTLPTGLSLSGATINGKPTQKVLNSAQTFKVTGSTSSTASSSGLEITIAATQLSITTTTCASGAQYQPYSGCTIAATGGTPPYTYASSTNRTYSALPEGMALNSSTGAITSSLIGGQGRYMTEFIATDAQNAQAKRIITFSLAGSNAFLEDIFPSNSIFHHRVDAASTGLPVDTSPAAPIPNAYLNSPLKPGFGYAGNGQFPNGIPAIEVPYNQPLVNVITFRPAFQCYFGVLYNLNPCKASGSAGPTRVPIPPYAPQEGTANQVGPPGSYIGDGHVIVYLEAGGGHKPALYEMNWAPLVTGTWEDVGNALWPDVTSNYMTPQGGGTADAAGLPIGPLLVNADEVIGTGTPSSPNGTIQHTIRFTLKHMLNYWVWPGTQSAGVGSCKAIGGKTIPTETRISQSSPLAACGWSAPAGEIYRLKASFSTPSCASTSPQANVIITAYRHYGIIVADNGGTFIIGTSDNRWNDSDLACLKNITLADFEPVNVSSLMINTSTGQTSSGRGQAATPTFSPGAGSTRQDNR